MKTNSIHVGVYETGNDVIGVEYHEKPTRVQDWNTGEIDKQGTSLYQMRCYHDL